MFVTPISGTPSTDIGRSPHHGLADVPLAGLHGKPRNAWWKIVELWTVSPVANIAAGAVIALIVTTHGVLPEGSGTALVDVSESIHANHVLALFCSAVFAGALGYSG